MGDEDARHIDDDEYVVRFILTPFHVSSKGKLKANTFLPRKGTRFVSVARPSLIGEDGCKAKAKAIVSDKGEYKGVAVLRADDIRACKCDVHDARDEFYGHAHLDLGIAVPIDDPLPSDQKKLLDDRVRRLVELARYMPDPDSSAERWTGGPMVYAD